MNNNLSHQNQTVSESKCMEILIQEWHQLISLARQHLLLEDWIKAIPIYEKAISLSERFLWATNCQHCAIKSYIRTSLEYIYALKKLHKDGAMQHLFNAVKKNMDYYASPSNQHLLQPLQDIMRVNEATADSWMNQLFYFDAESRSRIH
jgi:tetratricopeptide (TPR) repeat protein